MIILATLIFCTNEGWISNSPWTWWSGHKWWKRERREIGRSVVTPLRCLNVTRGDKIKRSGHGSQRRKSLWRRFFCSCPEHNQQIGAQVNHSYQSATRQHQKYSMLIKPKWTTAFASFMLLWETATMPYTAWISFINNIKLYPGRLGLFKMYQLDKNNVLQKLVEQGSNSVTWTNLEPRWSVYSANDRKFLQFSCR